LALSGEQQLSYSTENTHEGRSFPVTVNFPNPLTPYRHLPIGPVKIISNRSV